MTIRRQIEELEQSILHPRACLSMNSRGRLVAEREGEIRTCFQRDRDRIIHSKAFRRLKHKTQVFLAPRGDHYRTRLTHVLEVSQIARTVSRALRLNEDLTEAIALGHDLGHTPFGHAGESVLKELHPGGFDHYEQSLRIVDLLEQNGKGLNLTHEVRDGIAKHSKGSGSILPAATADLACTLEGQVVRVSDIIAYLNHDLDDALRAGVIRRADIPAEVVKVLGDSHSKRIDTMVKDLVFGTLAAGLDRLAPGEEVSAAMYRLREFLFEKVYNSERILSELNKAKHILRTLYAYYMEQPDLRRQLPAHFFDLQPPEKLKDRRNRSRLVCDFIAGMTDRFAIMTYERLFLPQQWTAIES